MPYNNYLNRYMKVSSLVSKAKTALDDDVILFYKTFNQTWSNRQTVFDDCPFVQPAFRTEKVSVFYGRNERVAVFVGDDFAYVIDKPNENFREDIKNCFVESVSKAKEKYEIKIEIFT